MFTKPVRLLIFYALAMQCMSTLAVVRRETGSWKWPVFRFLFMSGLLTRGLGGVYGAGLSWVTLTGKWLSSNTSN